MFSSGDDEKHGIQNSTQNADAAFGFFGGVAEKYPEFRIQNPDTRNRISEFCILVGTTYRTKSQNATFEF